MTTIFVRDGHELGKKRTGSQLVCDLSFESVDRLEVVQTNCKARCDLFFISVNSQDGKEDLFKKKT